jgi:hypothetical protein
MSRFIAFILALSVALQPVFALARDRYRLPVGKRLTTPQGTFQGYSLEEMKVLLKMDVDLESYNLQIPKFAKVLKNSGELISNLRKQLESKDKSLKILQDERVRLTKKWTEENKLRHIAENKPSLWTWIAWSSAGAMAVVATVLAIVLVVEKK